MQEQLIDGAIKYWEKYRGDFAPLTNPVNSQFPFRVYDLQYDHKYGLNHLEMFGEGIFYIAGRLKVERRYIRHNCSP
jgi:hypothetical protein